MAARYGDDQIASGLNRLGRRTGKGNRWNEHRVASARKSHGLGGQARTKVDPEILSSTAAAQHAGVSDTTIRRLVEASLLRCESPALSLRRAKRPTCRAALRAGPPYWKLATEMAGPAAR